MKVKLKVYSNQHNYEKDFPDREEMKESTSEAIKEAREGVAKVRGTNQFIGYKIFDRFGSLKYRLPSY